MLYFLAIYLHVALFKDELDPITVPHCIIAVKSEELRPNIEHRQNFCDKYFFKDVFKFVTVKIEVFFHSDKLGDIAFFIELNCEDLAISSE